MGRPRVSDRGRSVSVYLKPFIEQALDEHGISPTEALTQWYDFLIDSHESTLYEREIEDLKLQLETKKRHLQKAREREERVANRAAVTND